jgi:chemotaxis protein methyltransferase CheR
MVSHPSAPSLSLKPSEFSEFRDLVYRASGITLGEGKEGLVTSRLGKRMRALGLPSFRAYLDRLGGRDGEEELVHMLDAISTNVTSFFRESSHFDLLRDEARAWHAAGQRRFRFWSAASSSGEEPYSLAITLAEAGVTSGADVSILATDISTRILAAASAGVYPEARLAGLPDGYAKRWFQAPRSRAPGSSEVRSEIRSMVRFHRLNLAEPPFPMQGPLDAIFVRNVMIYFDNAVRSALVAECRRLLKPGGYLLIGHAETLGGMAEGFKCLKPSVYRKQG